jgi:hypothetical protein
MPISSQLLLPRSRAEPTNQAFLPRAQRVAATLDVSFPDDLLLGSSQLHLLTHDRDSPPRLRQLPRALCPSVSPPLRLAAVRSCRPCLASPVGPKLDVVCVKPPLPVTVRGSATTHQPPSFAGELPPPPFSPSPASHAAMPTLVLRATPLPFPSHASPTPQLTTQ